MSPMPLDAVDEVLALIDQLEEVLAQLRQRAKQIKDMETKGSHAN
jgi:hypothetical protein